MILTEQDLLTILGVVPSEASAQERASAAAAVRESAAAVKRILRYDPEQAVHTEILSRADFAGGIGAGASAGWDVNRQHTRAVYERRDTALRSLQLTTLPIRSITSLHVDTSAKFGQASGAFAATTAWTLGDEFWIEWERTYSGSPTIGIGRSGMLISNGNWPTEPGSVKVVYRAGYSPKELAGLADTDETAQDGTITMARVDASGILRATRLIAIKAFHTWVTYAKKTRIGFVPGAMQSENAGDYSYSLGGSGAGITDMKEAVPPEAAAELEEFVNWGIMLRG